MKRLTKKIAHCFFYLAATAYTTANAAIEEAAINLASGEYIEIETGISLDHLTDNNISVLTWSDSAGWDSKNKEVHAVCKRASKFPHRHLIYGEEDNLWSYTIENDVFGETGHCYDGNTTDSVRGEHYFWPYYSRQIYKHQDNTWTTLPTPPISRTAAMSLSWVHSSDAGSGLLAVSGGDKGAAWFNPETNTWMNLKNDSNYPIDGVEWGEYHVISEYNPIHNFTLIGGGNGANNVLYKMDASLNFTLLSETPFRLGAGLSLLSVEPNSGLHIAYNFENSEWWRFDAEEDLWWKLEDAQSPPKFDAAGALQVPIPEYGVIFFVGFHAGEPKTFIYRPLSSEGDDDSKVPAKPENIRIEYPASQE